MDSIKRFLKRNLDNIILILLCLPGCWWCSQVGAYNKALSFVDSGLASMWMFFIILLGVVAVFTAFSFKIKRSFVGYVIMAVSNALIIVPIVALIMVLLNDKVNDPWIKGKLGMVIQFIVLEVILLGTTVGAFFRIDYTKRDID